MRSFQSTLFAGLSSFTKRKALGKRLVSNLCSHSSWSFFVVFSHILERGAKKGTALDHRSKEPALSAPSKHAPSPVDENRRVEEFEKRLRFAMEQSLYLQAQHLSALDKFEKDLTLAKEESLLSHALFKSRLEAPAREESKKPLKGILKKSRR